VVPTTFFNGFVTHTGTSESCHVMSVLRSCSNRGSSGLSVTVDCANGV
jgi:hypothetical protein